MKTFRFRLYNKRTGSFERREFVEAENKTQARRIIREDFRDNVPSSDMFFKWSDYRITWEES